MNAMLHLFLGVGVDEEEVGDLSLDKMSNPQLFRYGLGEDGPVPIYTSKTMYTALILNLGNFIRGRKKVGTFPRSRITSSTTPAATRKEL